MSMDRNITFMHISQFILASKSTSFTFFHMNIHTHHHIFRKRFVYIHTFFRRKIMCGCRLATWIYDIRRISYEHRLYYSHVAPSVQIWAEFTSVLGKIYPWVIRAVTPVLSHDTPPRLYIGTYYWGKFAWPNPHTHTWEKSARFFRAEPLYVLYIAGKM